MKYILTPPTGCRFLRMTRPIEKVQRRARLQIGVLVFNTFNIFIFLASGIVDYLRNQNNGGQLIVLEVATFFFFTTVLFYILTLIDPGYVPRQPNFLRLLKQLIAENYHLDYVCVPCETLRPENADHCNFCNRCVQKFDHHCVFVNNCLGYRNHRWFLLFLVSFTIYMIGLLLHTILQVSKFVQSGNPFQRNTKVVAAEWTVQIYLIFVVLLHSPIVLLQLQSQIGKLCRKEYLQQHASAEADETTTVVEFAGQADDVQSTVYDQQSMLGVEPQVD